MPDDRNQQRFAVTLDVTPELRNTITRESTALTEVQSYVIDSPEVAQVVVDDMNAIKRRIVNLETTKATFTKPAKEILDAANNLFDAPLNALREAEKFCKHLLAGWGEQERLRLEREKQVRDAEERRIRQEAEQKAAAARALAEEVAAAKRREADEAARKAEQARAEGNARAAAAAEAKAASLNQAAQSALENGAAKAQTVELEAAAQMQPAPAVTTPAVNGVQYRNNWVAKLRQGVTEEQAKRLIIAECAKEMATGTSPLLACLTVDTKALGRIAKGLQQNMSVPGYEAVNERIVAGSNK